MKCFQILEPVHQCRNRGGTDVTVCSSETNNKYPTDGNLRKDIICGAHRPLVRYCHISALNDPSEAINFKFSPYSGFDAASAAKVCNEMGAYLPHLETELDHFYLTNRMENLLDKIKQGIPYTLKFLTWPVSITMIYYYSKGLIIKSFQRSIISRLT